MLSLAPPTTETSFEELRAREFARLDAQGHVYLDYTGSALYGESQIRTHCALLREGLFGNPHSEHRPSRASTEILDHARASLLRFFDVDAETHDVIFTANASAAIKLIAESYPFSRGRGCILSADNHNSVNGIREYAHRAGAPVHYVPLDEELRLRAEKLPTTPCLLAFPAQSNFSGVRHPLSLVTRAKALGHDVLLDVAALAPSRAISLRDCPADFAVLSFYKLFGYPTGIGALIARRESLLQLMRPWFAGGTVLYASVRSSTHRLRPRHEAFEDGTPNFLAIAALHAGFALLEEAGMMRLSAHVARLTSIFLDELIALRHANGTPLARIHGPRTMNDRGGTIAFNICDGSGAPIPYSIVETRATRASIAVRGGCFCNPGAAEAAFGLTDVRDCLDSLGSDFTVERFAACTGSAVGAVRVSLGMANNAADVRRVVDVIASFG